jgi:hypothetical protein
MRRALALAVILTISLPALAAEDQPWSRHVIDASSRGADGIRLADANGDARPDLVTGWEQGGITRLYLNPGVDKPHLPWPAVTVGQTPDVEDAVLVDLDGDGSLDVVTCMEGRTRRMDVHWCPADAGKRLDPAAWMTQTLPASKSRMMWMFCVPMDVDGKHGIDLVAGGKGPGAAVGWFEAPADPRDLAKWQFHPIDDCGWIMSIEPVDMDRDGDVDLLMTDRKGERRGCCWLENPGRKGDLRGRWPRHAIGEPAEVMFLARGQLLGDGRPEIVTGHGDVIEIHEPLDDAATKWRHTRLQMPANTGAFKAVSIADMDLDGRADLVITCEGAAKGKHGVFLLRQPLAFKPADAPAAWPVLPISGSDGVKHDLCPLLDLDDDGDLDVLTTEEVKELGVIWYENPTKQKASR